MSAGVFDSITIWAAVLGGVIGALGTFLVRFFFDRRRLKEETVKLRKALRSEMESNTELAWWAEQTEDADDAGIPANALTSTTVFQQNSGNLGLLSEDELEAVVAFYTAARVLRSHIEGAHHMMASPELDYQEVGPLHNALQEAEEDRQAALEELDERLGND